MIASLAGTGGSTGEWKLFDEQERRDLYDLVEWAAASPGPTGRAGMIGISYFAIAQAGAAIERPPHLQAIFPFELGADGTLAAEPRPGFPGAPVPGHGAEPGRPGP